MVIGLLSDLSGTLVVCEDFFFIVETASQAGTLFLSHAAIFFPSQDPLPDLDLSHPPDLESFQEALDVCLELPTFVLESSG